MRRDFVLSCKRLFPEIFSSMSESAGGQEGRETVIFRGLEINSVSGKECFPECCCGVVGSVRDGRPAPRLGPPEMLTVSS